MMLSLFMPKVRTPKEAESLYLKSKNSKSKDSALNQWNNLCLPLLKKAVEEEDVEEFFNIVRNIPEKGEARDYVYESLDFMISLISNSQQARILYRMDKFYSKKIIDKWNILSRKEMEKADSFLQKILVLSNCFYDKSLNNVFSEELIKLIEDCQNLEEVEKLCDHIYRMKGCHLNPVVTELFREKRFSLLLEELPQVKDVDRIRYLYSISPEKTIISLLIFEKWLILCQTLEEANEALYNARNEEICRIEAQERIKELAP